MLERTILVRSASDGQLTTRPVFKHHPAVPHDVRTGLLQQETSHKPAKRAAESSNYGSSNDFLPRTQAETRNYGSYWSPAISENDHQFEPLGRHSLNRRARLYRLIFFLLQMSLVITQISAISSEIFNGKLYACTIFIGYSSAAFLSAAFAPVIFTRGCDHIVLLSTSVCAACYAGSRLVATNIFLQLPVAIVCGGCSGLLIVKQGLWALNLGLQYSCVESLKEQKKTAGDFYLFSQVAAQSGSLLGSMVWSAIAAYLMPSWNFSAGAEKQCGKKACGPLTLFADQSPNNNWTVRAEGQYAKQARMIDEADDHANRLLGLIATTVALTAFALAGLAFCLSKLASRRRRRGPHRRQHPHQQPHRMDDGNKEKLSVNSETTQIYNESPIRQLHNLLHLLLYDHKLQTLLPLVFFTGLQAAFIATTFAKDFVACALGKTFIGWTMSTYSGTYLASLWIIYKSSQRSKRLYLLFWVVLFQSGIGAVVMVWMPANHDTPMFFIVAAVFGLVEGALTALVSGFLVRMFAHNWLGTYSAIVAFKTAGFVAGLCSTIFLCTVAQMYLFYGVFVVALIPYVVLEWKYDTFLHRRRQFNENSLL